MIIKSTVGKIDAAIGRVEGPLLAYMMKEETDFAKKSLKKELFGVHTSKSYAENVAGMTGIGDWVATDGTVPYEDFEETYPKQFIHEVIQKGVQIKRETIDDNRIFDMRNQTSTITDSYNRTVEKFVHAKFNNPATATFTLAGKTFDNVGADGKALCVADHPSKTGKAPAQSNVTDYSLTAGNVKLCEEMANNFVDETGEKSNIVMDTILIPFELRNEAWELFGTPAGYNADTGQENVNPYFEKYKIIVSRWLTDADAWYMLDSNYMKKNNLWIDRVPMEVESQKDFNTGIWQIKGYSRFSLGHVDWRWCIGNIPA